MSEGITILRLHIKDYQGMRVAELDDLPPVGLVVIQGPVGSGKTSIVNAIRAGLGGKAGVHERAVHDDAENGFSIDLSLTNGFRIDRHSTPADPKGALHILGPDGGKFGQSKLNEFVGPLSLDVLAYQRLSQEKRVEIIMSLDSDPERAGRIATLREEGADLVEERKPFTRELMKIRQQTEPEGDRPEAVDVSATAATLKVLNAKVAEAEASRRAAVDAERNLNTVMLKVAGIEDEISTAEASLISARDALNVVQDEALEFRVSVDEAVKKVLPMPDGEEIGALEEALARAGDIAASLAPWQEWDRAVAREGTVKEDAAKLTKKIEANAAKELAELAAIEMPIEGMEVSATGDVLWKGRPLSSASGGENIAIAIAIAFAINPELKVCILDEANNIGQPQLAAVHTEAVKRGFQIFACRLEGEGDITVRDGVATQ